MSQSSAAGKTDVDPFQPIPTLRSSERIASIIRKTIIEGRFGVGELLPPERTLAKRFAVTRNTVREALRHLEQLRLVSIRQGSGVTVRDYNATAGVELLGLMLASSALGGELLVDVLEARAVIGRAINNNAIEKIDAAGIEALDVAAEAFAAEAEKATPDLRRLQEIDFDVHNALVRGGGNQAIIFLHNSLRRVYAPIAHLFEQIVADPRELASLYRRIVAALRRGDREDAAAASDAVFAMGRTPPPQTGGPDAHPA